MTPFARSFSLPANFRHSRRAATMMLAVSLTACGGGGGSSAPGSGNTGTPHVSVSGVAAIGDPLASAAIVLKDQQGASRTATSASDGSFSVDVTGLTAPFLIQATSQNGNTVLFSAATKEGSTNIDPFTDLAINGYYRALGSSAASAFANITNTSLLPSQIELDNLAVAFRNVLGAALLKHSLAAAFNIFNTGFSANGAGFDLLLHETQSSGLGFTFASGSLSITDSIAAASGRVDFSNTVNDSASGASTTSVVGVTVAATTQQQQRDEQDAVAAVSKLWTGLLQVAAAKGIQVAAADVAPFIDSNYLDRGATADVFAVELAAFLNTMQRGQTLSLDSVGRVFDFADAGGPTTLRAEVDFTVKNTAGASFTFPFIKHFQEGFLHDGRPGLVYIKESDGSYKLYGDQSIAYTAVYASSNNYYAASGAASGTVFALSAFAPFASSPSLTTPRGVGTVAGITITSDQGALPVCSGNQPYVLGGSSVALTQAVALNGFAQTLNGEELFLGCNGQLLATTTAPQAGSKYAITYTRANGQTSSSSAQIDVQSSEVPNLISINGVNPASFLAGHHAQDVAAQPLSLSWSLPTTFAIDSINIACNTFDAFGNQFFLEPTYLAPTALHERSDQCRRDAIAAGGAAHRGTQLRALFSDRGCKGSRARPNGKAARGLQRTLKQSCACGLMNYDTLEYERIDAVARIYLNRPEKRNAQNARLLEELEHALACAGADAAVRVVVLGGRGTHFSAGHDVVELGRDYLQRPIDERYAFEEARYYQCALKLWDLPKPVIAEVRGGCVAGAFMLAAMCDLIVASEETYFADPVVHMGAAAAEVLFHPWVLGARLAKDILYTGRRLSAQEAHQIGLVNRLVPDQELEASALALAQQIAGAPAFTLKLLKNSIHRALDMQGFRTALNAHFDTHQLSHAASVAVADPLKSLKQHLEKGK